jgi:hypothetical protein
LVGDRCPMCKGPNHPRSMRAQGRSQRFCSSACFQRHYYLTVTKPKRKARKGVVVAEKPIQVIRARGARMESYWISKKAVLHKG